VSFSPLNNRTKKHFKTQRHLRYRRNKLFPTLIVCSMHRDLVWCLHAWFCLLHYVIVVCINWLLLLFERTAAFTNNRNKKPSNSSCRYSVAFGCSEIWLWTLCWVRELPGSTKSHGFILTAIVSWRSHSWITRVWRKSVFWMKCSRQLNKNSVY
jgi:hypothetical protein